jgi:hypothetical protein
MSGNWEISDLRSAENLWTDFIRAMPNSVIFHHPAWINLLAECYHLNPFLLLSKDAQGKIEAGIPFIETIGLFNKKKWVSLPFTDHCEPLSISNDSLTNLSNALRDLSSLGKEIELRWNFADEFPFPKFSQYYYHQLLLDNDERNIEKRIDPKDFRQVRVAYKRGITIDTGTSIEHVKSFYNLHVDTRHRKGVPVQPWHFFELLQKTILDPGFGFVVLAYKQKACMGAAIFLNWNRSMIYKYSALADAGRQLLAMDPILWTAIRWGCQNGYQILDMGRTDMQDVGLRRFKERWGAERTMLSYSSSQPHISNRGEKVLPILQTIIKISPTCLCRVIGETLYGYFG